MAPNTLITGAAGYIGGSLVADLISGEKPLLQKENVIAAVRSEDQAAVVGSVLHHNISIIIQTASSINPGLSLPLITALGKQREVTGEETYFIHTSGLSAFCEKTGWPHGETKDTDAVFDTEKELADSFPIRKTDVDVIEYSKTQGVTSFIVIPCQVYGKGSGAWNQLSVVLPIYVKTAIERKRVYKFPENTKVPGVHISDMTALYGQIIKKILHKEPLPSGTDGYYFGLGHDLHWWEVLDHLATALKARDLITDSKVELWPNDEAAAESLGVPAQFLQILWNTGENILAERPRSIGWDPAWTKDRFLQNIDDEIDAVLELGAAKSSLIDSLFAAARG